MTDQVVTLEMAIGSIKTAADELPPEDFISYSTILDVHLSHALEEFSPEDQLGLLEALQDVLKSHEGLARDIAWDLVFVLLPFLESSLDKTVDAAEGIIKSSAAIGNPREVFIKVLEALSLLSWVPVSAENVESGAEDSGGEQDEATRQKKEDEKKVADSTVQKNTSKKFQVLLAALAAVYPRISSKFPSRFLSTGLSTLLGTFMKATEAVDLDTATNIVQRLLSFLGSIRPQLQKWPGRQLKQGERPPLPPRQGSISVPPTEEGSGGGEESAAEAELQARLIATFLSHVVETFLLRTRRQAVASTNEETRGLELGWAGKYDERVLRPKTSKVPGGRTLIDIERAERESRTGVRELLDEISWMCETLGLTTRELFEICTSAPAPETEEEDDHADLLAPKSASDVPVPKHGALFLLAHRASSSDDALRHLEVFPEHSNLSQSFMVYQPGQSQFPVIDAVLFLGALALRTGGLGDIPDTVEPFLMYLQVFAVMSSNATSAQARFLAHYYVSSCLRAHPNEAVRLAYIKDTLEHCPFESLKAAVVGILKDEISYATTPQESPSGGSVPSTPISIFGTPLALQDLFQVLFPDISAELGGDNQWGKFKEIYTRLLATVNLLIFLVLGRATKERLGVTDSSFLNKLEKRFLAPLREKVEAFEGKPKFEGGTEVEILKAALERLDEIKAQSYLDE